MPRSHTDVTVDEFNGLFDRGLDDAVPSDHAIQGKNMIYKHLGTKTRPGFDLDLTLPNIIRHKQWRRIGEADRQFLLDSSGQLFDSTDLVTPILTIATMTDFGLISMFNRAYIVDCISR